jgi:hypothetical protein
MFTINSLGTRYIYCRSSASLQSIRDLAAMLKIPHAINCRQADIAAVYFYVDTGLP